MEDVGGFNPGPHDAWRVAGDDVLCRWHVCRYVGPHSQIEYVMANREQYREFDDKAKAQEVADKMNRQRA